MHFILETDKLKVCCIVIVNVIRIVGPERLTNNHNTYLYIIFYKK